MQYTKATEVAFKRAYSQARRIHAKALAESRMVDWESYYVLLMRVNTLRSQLPYSAVTAIEEEIDAKYEVAA